MISVVLPVFNGERYLAAALDSILAQTYADFELLIADDGSTDSSLTIADAYASRDARIRVLRLPHAGLIATLNRAAAEARGEWIARMDADDIAFPQRFQRQVEFLREHPAVVALGTAMLRMDAESRPIDTVTAPTTDREIRNEMPKSAPLFHPTVVMNAAVLRRVGGYRAAFKHAEDFDLWLRIKDHGELANLPEPLYRYRVHAEQVSAVHAEQQIVSVFAAQIAERLRRSGRDDPFDRLPKATREFVREHGVAEAEIDEAVVAHAIRQILLRSPDRFDWTQDDIAVLRALGRDRGMGGYPIARLWFEAGYRHFAAKHYLRAVGWTTASILRHPRILGRLLRLTFTSAGK